MPKTNKELAVDVALAVIHAHSVKLAIASNNAIKETRCISLEEITEIINCVHGTLECLGPEEIRDFRQ